MNSADIINEQREHLVKKIINRTPLLRFVPPKGNTAGSRLDVCDIFPQLKSGPNQSGLVGTANPQSGPQHPGLFGTTQKPAISYPAGLFLQPLLKKGRAKMDVPGDSKIPGKLRNLNKAARDDRRTTGQWPLVLTWPFLYVPEQELENTTKPLFAPLFLWQIKTQTGKGKGGIGFELMQDAGQYNVEINFVLSEYLKLKSQLDLPEPDEDVLQTLQESTASFDDKVGAIKDYLGGVEWIHGVKGFEGELMPYSPPNADKPALCSVAVIGRANSKYLALYRDMEDLKDKSSKDEELGLLAKLMANPGEDEVDFYGNGFPREEEKWLVEQSDPSQEQAVWLAGKDDVPIVRVEGPPGTGKSQTIVNIVADALRRKERVAVVCDHAAALNVVGKRMEGAGLGDLVVQITSPKEDRSRVIKKARDAADGGKGAANRTEMCKLIEEKEEFCDDHVAAFSPPQASSTERRGHFLAKIHAIKEKIPFNPLLPGHDPLVNAVKQQLASQAENGLLDEVRDISDSWQRCNYPQNPWRDISPNWNGDPQKLVARFESLLEQIGGFDGKGLPGRKTLAFISHPIAATHYAGMVSGARKASTKCFLDIVQGTRDAFGYAQTPCPPLWESLYPGSDARQIYNEYKESISAIGDVLRVKKSIAANSVIGVLARDDGYKASLRHWPEMVESAVCKARYDLLPQPKGSGPYQKALQNLRDAIGEKPQVNAAKLIRANSGKARAAQKLKNAGLLRLKGGGGKTATSLRALYHKGAEQLWNIFPVLLTNPASVSQILPLAPKSIDLLIVDEASQMFTADAMPSLYRAKRAVISGDEHQMPPSDFFTLQGADDDGHDETDEHEGKHAGLPFELLEAVQNHTGDDRTKRLAVHYRSRPEELIAFSNHAFYKGRLQAAPYNGDSFGFLNRRAIHVHPVAGEFKDGENQAEAGEIIAKLREVWLENPDLSVGVIVFNVRQRDLVNDRLEKEARADAEFKRMYEESLNLEDKGEDVGLFVRSVEHIQGDERDVIIMGTTYGSKTANYGPIGIAGLGRRRLNVAVTRAKQGMLIATSLEVGRIANEGLKPDGAGAGTGAERWYLWKYMQYACAVSNGDRKASVAILRSINPPPDHPVGKEPENEFEKQVADFLRSKGLHVVHQVGESGFRIDLGVKTNSSARTYLCGVECDGRIYHSGWRARQNDIWRQGILEDKGWRIVRVWSNEWFSGNPKHRTDFLERVRPG